MASRKASASPEERAAELSRILNAGQVVEVRRDQLVNAPYNPRTISDKARRKLETGLRKHGLISLLTWNKRSGNIVGGHQRVAIIDDIAGTKDYAIKVLAVDMSDHQEKEANLLLNNPEAQGDTELAKLEAILRDSSVELEATGYDVADMYRLFGDAPIVDRDDGAMQGLADSLRAAQERYASVGQKSAKRDGTDYYIVVVFRDDEDRQGFLEALGLDDNRFQDGREFRRLFKVAQEPAAEQDSSTDSSESNS